MRNRRWYILNCGVCGEEHWHNPQQSEVICFYCKEWAETMNARQMNELMNQLLNSPSYYRFSDMVNDWTRANVREVVIDVLSDYELTTNNQIDQIVSIIWFNVEASRREQAKHIQEMKRTLPAILRTIPDLD